MDDIVDLYYHNEELRLHAATLATMDKLGELIAGSDCDAECFELWCEINYLERQLENV